MDSWKSYSTRSDNYAAEKAAALAQSKQNSYMQGLQSVHETGFGQSISDSRDGKYGNVNIMPQQLIQRLRKMAKGGMHNLNDRSALYPQGG